ncbi:MAG: DMT family transporter [bacterium]|nr:DMT family transporter [bacterium]
MIAIVFSLLVNTAYFLADIFIKLGSNQQSPARLIYIRSIFSVAIASLWLLSSGDLWQTPSLGNLSWLLLCSFLCGIGLYFYVKALQNLSFVNVSVIGIMGAFIHYALGVYLYHETVNSWFFFAALLSCTGILIQWRKSKNHKGMLEALISAVCWGFGYALLSIPLANTSAIWGTWVMELSILVMAAFTLIMQDPAYSLLRPKLNQWKLMAVAFFTILGSVLVNISYQKFSLNILGFMQLAFFPYSILAGYFIFKEKLNAYEWIGNSLVVAGLVVYYITCV